MKIIGWHGGWGNFSTVDESYLGSGEGDSQGWGFYISENRSGGEYFARYLKSHKGKGFLHKVQVEIEDYEYWENADTNETLLSNGEICTYDKYIDLRHKLGDRAAAKYLSANGVKTLMLWEPPQKPSHGYTYVVLQPDIVQVLESYEFIDNQVENYWQQIA